MTEETETLDEFEMMQPRAAALVKADALRELRSNMEKLYRDIGIADLFLLNDLMCDWVSLTDTSDGSFASVLAVRFARLAADGQ